MRNSFIGIVLGLAVLVSPKLALSQGLEEWGTVGAWDVLIDPSLGNGCLIQAAYEDGSLVRIGFDRNEGLGYVTAFNENWGGIEEGTVYPIKFDLDGEEFDGEAKGIYLNGVPGADIQFDDEEFLFAIAKKYTMTLYNENGEVMAIDLEGTFNGLEAALECQDEVN